MSFKREGDDAALLNSLQHRRVAELLGSHIPDTEASLLSNGRLTCLICSYRPVFDTIAMLAVHRQGKKHIHELSRYLQRLAELEARAVKETQQTHVYAGLTTKELSRSPCKSRRFCHDRRMVMEAATPAANVLISPPEGQPSASSLVRKYLKSVERSRPLQKTVDKRRENYGGESAVSEETSSAQPDKSDGKKERSIGPQVPQPMPEKSGWRLNKEGEWEKDPDAEFESEDEDL